MSHSQPIAQTGPHPPEPIPLHLFGCTGDSPPRRLIAIREKARIPRTVALSRRRILQASAGTLVLAGAAALRHVTSGYAAPHMALVVLSTKEYRIVEAIAARFLATNDPDFPTPESLNTAARIDRVLQKLDDTNLAELRQLLHFIEHALPLRHGYLTRFSRLEAGPQRVVLEGMSKSSVGLLRGAFVSLKGLVSMAYFADARTWPAIGYDGPRIESEALAQLGRGNTRRV